MKIFPELIDRQPNTMLLLQLFEYHVKIDSPKAFRCVEISTGRKVMIFRHEYQKEEKSRRLLIYITGKTHQQFLSLVLHMYII